MITARVQATVHKNVPLERMEKTVANKNIFDKDFILLDGAMGTMLQQKGMELGTVPETLNITKPDWIIDIHKQYIDAGSDVVYANTFGANRYKMANTGYSVDELIGAAINNAKEAAKGTETLVALDMGPIGQLLEPTGSLSFEEAYDIFKEEVIAGRNAGADQRKERNRISDCLSEGNGAVSGKRVWATDEWRIQHSGKRTFCIFKCSFF